MAYFLFVDESGQDHRESPYEVLAGIAVEDRALWSLVTSLHESEVRFFGRRYTPEERELKAKRLLKAKTFRLAAQLSPIGEDERRELAYNCLARGAGASRLEITALAQAKLAFVWEALEICSRFQCRAFASIVSRNARTPDAAHLRKVYAYLLERFFYFLEDQDTSICGAVVFDELEKSRSHILVGQMERYFKFTTKGRQRAGQIVPEPFFVHSDLTTGIQLADLVAYIVSWGFRFGNMKEPHRPELEEMARLVGDLRYKTSREVGRNRSYPIWSFTTISDLRPRDAQG